MCVVLLSGITFGCQKTTNTPPKATAQPIEHTTKTPPKPGASRTPPMTNKTYTRGYLDIDRVSGGKRAQPVTLKTATTTYLLAYRPDPKYYPFVGKEVLAELEPYQPEGQAMSGDHARVKSIKLAPDQTPHNPVPTKLLPPKIVTTKAELLSHIGKWVQFEATFLKHHKPKTSRYWTSVHLKGPGGLILRAHISESSLKDGWQGTVTVVGQPQKPTTPKDEYLKKERAEIDKALGNADLHLAPAHSCKGPRRARSNVDFDGPTCIEGPSSSSKSLKSLTTSKPRILK